jgi:hypothetical protein
LSQECYVEEPSSLIILVGGYGVFINDGWWFLTNEIIDRCVYFLKSGWCKSFLKK